MLIALLRHRVSLALLAAGIVVGSLLTTEILKLVVLERPNLLGPAAESFTNSFPSGHTTIAFSIGVAAILVSPPALRRIITALALLYGTVIGVATVAAGWHRPSDVVAAMFIVTGWTALLTLIVTRVDPDAFSDDRRGMQPATIHHYVVLGFALAFIGAVVAIGISFASNAGRINLTDLNAAFTLSALSIAGLAALLLAATLDALSDALPSRAAAPTDLSRSGPKPA